MIVYKIRNKVTGKYRLSGGEPRWNKTGKTFETLGRLRQMISNCMSYNNSLLPRGQKNDFSEWEIVEYEITEMSHKDMHEYVKPEKIIELLKD